MSFYGGRPGTSFIVKKTFLSLDEMYTAFKKGPDYTEVWYGEYCVIDTPNKNDPDNGKIFRRGVNYTHTATSSDGTVYHDGGAEYLGQFVGTSSGTPFFSMGALKDVVAKSEMDVDTSVWQEKAYPIAYNESTGTFDVYHDTDNEGDDPTIGVFSFAADNASGMLVPGKDVDEKGNVTYNDDLKWTWCNVRSADTNNDSWFYVGFQIPYPVVEISSQTFFPYDEDGKYDDTSTCTRDDDETHAFYRHYTITVPKGIKGESITNVHKVIVAEGDNFYTADDVSYENGKLVLSTPSYKGSEHVGDAILTYDILCYDDTDTPEAVSIYLCDYVIVDKAYMYDDGAITFFTNYNDRIDLVYADATGAIIYNEDGSPKVFRIKFVEDVKLSTDDELMEDKRIQIKYNTEQLYEAIGDEVNYVQEIVINPEDFHLLVLFNDRTHRFNLDSVKLGQYTVDDDGVYTDDSGCKWRRAVDLTNASSSIQEILGWNAEVNAYATTDSDVVQDTFWRDYGSVKDDAGLMVGLNVPTNDVWEYLGKTGYNLENDDVVDFLNTRYEGGLTGLNSGSSTLVGKMVTVGDGDSDKRFYAYDYQQNTWYFLGQIGYETLDAAVVSADGDSDDNPSIDQKDYYNVTKSGVIAVERDDDVDTSGVPRPWIPSYNEWNDDKFQTTGLVRDVLVGNDSVTDSGVATINLLSSTDTGVVDPSGLTGLEAVGDGGLRVADPTAAQLTARTPNVAVTCSQLDRAVDTSLAGGRNLAEVLKDEIPEGGTVYDALHNRCQAGDWTGLRVGDYINVKFSNYENVCKYSNMSFILAHINPYWHTGTNPLARNLIFLSRDPLPVPDTATGVINNFYIMWNESKTNNATSSSTLPYQESTLHAWENELFECFPESLQNVIIERYAYQEQRYSSSGTLVSSTGNTVASLGPVFSLSETEVFGRSSKGTTKYCDIGDIQLDLFRNKTYKNIYANWWLRTISDGTSNMAVYVRAYGYAEIGEVNGRWCQARPAFFIG